MTEPTPIDKAVLQPPKPSWFEGLSGWRTSIASFAVSIFGFMAWWCHNNHPEWEQLFIGITQIVLYPALFHFLRLGIKNDMQKAADKADEKAEEVKAVVESAKNETIDAAAVAVEATAQKVLETTVENKDGKPLL